MRAESACDVQERSWCGSTNADITARNRSGGGRETINSEDRIAAHLRGVTIDDACGRGGGGHVYPTYDSRIGVEVGRTDVETADTRHAR